MRLLNSKNCQLKTFFGENTPEYAILSHTWVEDSEQEILFDDIPKSEFQRKKKGAFSKFNGFRDIAAEDGHEWIWIDTCCIDKSSSAELSEAINSMFQWYKGAFACYVYLEDIDSSSESWQEEFVSSRWFTRGWTLQELLAPKVVQFYDRNWIELGTRNSLQPIITKATGIGREVLIRINHLSAYTVAERMSWAANRKTTRVEDIAYCLLGIFDVNMPLLYGEGVKSFRRLQEEIFKSTEDYTLLAWAQRQSEPGIVLAASPSSFYKPSNEEDCSWSYCSDNWNWQISSPFKPTISWNYSQLCSVNPQKLDDLKTRVRSIIIEAKKSELDEFPTVTPRGLRLTLPIIKDSSNGVFLAFLYSTLEPGGELVCLALEKNEDSNIYWRTNAGLTFLAQQNIAVETKTIYLKMALSREESRKYLLLNYLQGNMPRRRQSGTIILSIGTKDSPLVPLRHSNSYRNITYHSVLKYKRVVLHLFFGIDPLPWCYFGTEEDGSMSSWPTKSKDAQKAFIKENIAVDQTDRAEIRIKEKIISCTIKKCLKNWLDLQIDRLTIDDLKKAEDSRFFYSVTVWAAGDSIEIVSRETFKD